MFDSHLSHALLLALLALISELIGTVSGLGSSVLFVPLAQLFEPYPTVLVLTAVLHTFGNLARLWLFRKAFREVGQIRWLLKLALISTASVGLGAALVPMVSLEHLRRALGLLLFLFAIQELRRPAQSASVVARTSSYFWIAFSGFCTGLLGTGGAFRGATLSRFGLGTDAFVASSAGIDLLGDLLRGSIYIGEGYLQLGDLIYIPLLLLAAVIGTRIGQKILSRTRPEIFRKIVAGSILAGGIALLF